MTMGAPETLPVFLPLVFREIDFLLKLEQRLDSILEEEERQGLDICTEEILEMLAVCGAAQLRIARALNASAGVAL